MRSPELLVAHISLPLSNHPLLQAWLPFGFLGVIAWSVWLARRLLTSLYRPVDNDHWETTTVVAPAFREDPKILAASIRSWLVNSPERIIVVMPLDEPDHVLLMRHAFRNEPRVEFLTQLDSSKRNMLTVGIAAAQTQIVVLSDSDTLWEPDCLSKLLMPFADPLMGGVGTRQRVLEPQTSVWRRAADWMLDARYQVYVPAMARRGGVSCLSGRTVAYRRELLMRVLPGLKGETFFGKPCISGDDGRLTWLMLNAGYKCGYQHNALAWTMMPGTFRGFLHQRIRWSRNCWRCYLRAIVTGALFRQPMITRVSVLQGLLSPVSLCVGLGFTALAIARADYVAAGIWVVWMIVGRAIRAFDHLREDPRDILIAPLMMLVIVFLMTLVKFYGCATMNRQAWITRRTDRGAAEGQSAATVDSSVYAVLVAPSDGDA